MIQLTRLSGVKVYVNPETISALTTNEDNETEVYMGGNLDNYFTVKETPEEIILHKIPKRGW